MTLKVMMKRIESFPEESVFFFLLMGTISYMSYVISKLKKWDRMCQSIELPAGVKTATDLKDRDWFVLIVLPSDAETFVMST